MKKLNIKVVVNFLGVLLILNALFMFLCVPVSLYYSEEAVTGIALAALITATIGGIMYFASRKHCKTVQKREGYLIVTFGWIFMALVGTFPYLFSGSIPHFTDAFFETMSGFTTTGSSILNDIEAMPKGILFWRSFTHWIGGMGIIVLTLAILPLLGIGGMQLFSAESPGPSADKLHPRITETAKRLWYIYVLLTLIQAILLWGAGMTLFDAVNHALCTLSTGGFSTKNASVAYWNNQPLIQYIIIFFMFIAGTNFVLNYFFVTGKFKKMFKDEEFRWYAGMVLFVSIITALTMYLFANPSQSLPVGADNTINAWTDSTNQLRYTVEASIRHALFQVLAVVTTTGFVSADFTMWTPFLAVLFFALMFTGGSAGSTAGGVKVVRHTILIKNSWLEFKRLLHPNAIIPVRHNGKSVKQQIVFNILAFFMIYMLIFIFSSIILSFTESEAGTPNLKDFVSAIGVSASALGNVGPAFGNYSPVDNFASMTCLGKWFCSFLMLLGRLELFTILILFTPFFWRKN
ncbi:trk system potassium uptake protein [Flavobacteriaceae bacterium UJ101]|nr:trk system potassium uptake protein [Flavobacteriaceae bacterium UJ101]